jgi:hypothetical protein
MILMDEKREKRNKKESMIRDNNIKYGNNMEKHNHLITVWQFYLFSAQKRNKLTQNCKNIITLMITARSLMITGYLIPGKEVIIITTKYPTFERVMATALSQTRIRYVIINERTI